MEKKIDGRLWVVGVGMMFRSCQFFYIYLESHG
jgi:hypothetical protein